MSRDFDKAQEMVVASMEYVKVLGFRIRRTEVQRDDWKQVAQSHADEMIKLRQHVDALKAERDAAKQEAVSARQDAVTRAEADRKRIDGLMIQVQDMRAEIDSLKREERATHDTLKPLVERVVKERDALRTECDDLRRVFSLVHGSLGIQQGEHIGNAIDALKKERDDLTTRLRQSIARGDFAEMRAATLLAELAEQKPSFDPTVAKMESTAEASHITPEGKQTAEGALPQPGDVVRLVRVPTNDEYPHDSGRWEPNWGGIGDYMRVHYVGSGSNINGTRVVRAVFGLEWPLSCVEVVKGGDK